VWCTYRLGGVLRLPMALRLALTASFALATVALPYARQVNVHIMLLAVLSGMVLCLARLADDTGRTLWLRLTTLGFLAGLGYTLDLGAGLPLIVGLLLLVAYRCRRVGPVIATAAAALPWVVLHQAINYFIGGTFRPINSVPEFWTWPGCPYSPVDLTGTWKHTTLHFLTYAASMLLGKHGLIWHNLPLLLAVPAMVVVLRRRPSVRPELLYLAGWCAATWLMYAALSNNSSGVCCSIRWFVPFLAPAFYALAILLRDWPQTHRSFFVLSGWGLVMGGIMWWYGPWIAHMVPGYWPIAAACLLSWWACWRWSKRSVISPAPCSRQGNRAAAA
jgi:hypothetical protein